MTLYHLPNRTPRLGQGAWVAPNATVIGDVQIGDYSSIWFNAVLRGDSDSIIIGTHTNIQDGSIVHTDEGIPMEIGNGVTVGHKVMLHGCNVGNYSLIGIGSILLNHSRIGEYSIVGANTLIPEGKSFPDRVLILGSPGKIVRELTEEEINRLKKSADHYVSNSEYYRTHLSTIT